MVHETLHSFTPEYEPSPQEGLWQSLSSSEQLEDAETIAYWRTASVEEHARVLEEVLELADFIAQSKLAEVPLLSTDVHEPPQSQSAA